MDNVFKGEQANSWLNVERKCKLASSTESFGKVNFNNANRGNPAYIKVKPTTPERHMVNPSGNTRMTFQLQGKVNSMLAFFNDTDRGASGHSAPYVDGKLSTCVKLDFGGFGLKFPLNLEDKLGTKNAKRDDNKVSMDNNHAIYNSRGDGGRFARSTYFKSGLTVDPVLFAALHLFEVTIFDRSALVV
ncbi:hypothetical protein LRP88_11529 [Fusarium phalaenopsidis]